MATSWPGVVIIPEDLGGSPQGHTALHLAIANRKLAVAEELVNAETDLGYLTPQNNSSYLHFACQNGMGELIPLLVEKGVPLKAVDNDGRSALHIAAFSGSDKGCRSLIALGLSAAAVDLDGKLPMHLAAQGGQVDALQYLLQARLTPLRSNLTIILRFVLLLSLLLLFYVSIRIRERLEALLLIERLSSAAIRSKRLP